MERMEGIDALRRGMDGETTQTSELTRALEKLEQIVRDGLQHGFFECVVRGEIVNSGQKRRLVIRAGKSHQFTISADDLRS